MIINCVILQLMRTLHLQELQPGTKVLVENTYQKKRKGGKLKDKHKGPYEIHKSSGRGVYELKEYGWKGVKDKA